MNRHTDQLDLLDKQLLNNYQQDFPLDEQPYLTIAKQLGCNENEIIERLQRLQQQGFISRIGAVFTAGKVGASTLAAMQVPAERLDQIVELINDIPQVNHNYLREHHYNLWFVITANNQQDLQDIIAAIEAATQIQVLDLRLETAYHINLGFPLW